MRNLLGLGRPRWGRDWPRGLSCLNLIWPADLLNQQRAKWTCRPSASGSALNYRLSTISSRLSALGRPPNWLNFGAETNSDSSQPARSSPPGQGRSASINQVALPAGGNLCAEAPKLDEWPNWIGRRQWLAPCKGVAGRRRANRCRFRLGRPLFIISQLSNVCAGPATGRNRPDPDGGQASAMMSSSGLRSGPD